MKTTCGMFLFDRRGKFLICHPTGSDEYTWSIPKGLQEPGENYLESATRELEEETGIDLMKMTDSVKGVYDLPKVNYVHKLKTLRPFVVVTNILVPVGSLVCRSIAACIGLPECDDFKWVTMKEAEKLIHETQLRCLSRVKETFKKHQEYSSENKKLA